jgi:cytochrome c oxidase subunit II
MWDGKNSKTPAGVQIFLVVFCSAPAVAQTAGPPLSPTNIFAPASTPAQSIFGLSIFVLGVTAAIFAVVFTLLAYSVVKFRKRKNDDGREPPQVYGSNQVEVAWTVIPILIVVALFMATARVIAAYRTGPFTI